MEIARIVMNVAQSTMNYQVKHSSMMAQRIKVSATGAEGMAMDSSLSGKCKG